MPLIGLELITSIPLISDLITSVPFIPQRTHRPTRPLLDRLETDAGFWIAPDLRQQVCRAAEE